MEEKYKKEAEIHFARMLDVTEKPFLVAYYRGVREELENPASELLLYDLTWEAVDFWINKTSSTKTKITFKENYHDRPIIELFDETQFQTLTNFASERGRILLRNYQGFEGFSYQARWKTWGVELQFDKPFFSLHSLNKLNSNLSAALEVIGKIKQNVQLIIGLLATIGITVGSYFTIQLSTLTTDPTTEVRNLLKIELDGFTPYPAGFLIWDYRGSYRYYVTGYSKFVIPELLESQPPQSYYVKGWHGAYLAHTHSKGLFIERDNFPKDSQIHDSLKRAGVKVLYTHPLFIHGTLEGYVSVGFYDKLSPEEKEQTEQNVRRLVRKLEPKLDPLFPEM